MKNKSFSFLYFILYLGVFLTSNELFSQKNNLENELKKISFYLDCYEPDIVIYKVDSIFNKNKISPNSNYFFILQESKSLALIQAELYDESFFIIKKSLREKNIPIDNKVRLLNQLALIYELLSDFKNCELTLNECARLFENKKIKNNEEYGVFLYRKSSYYRVQNQDSLALIYAKRSNLFAQANNYKSVEAVSNMLLGFLCKPNEKEKKISYLKKALKYWKKTNDRHGVTNAYISIGSTYIEKNNLQLNFIYCDSALNVAKKTNFLNTISHAYLSKSNAFELLKNSDSALFYYKKFNEHSELKSGFISQLKINEQEINFQIEQEKHKKKHVLEENERIKKNYRILLFLIVLLLILISILVFQFQKIKKQNRLVNSQKIIILDSINELTKSVNEKQILFKELHHRVKNNLSLISSLVTFQSNSIEDEKMKTKFNDLQNRIYAISLAHERLLITENNKLLKEYNLNEFINAVSKAQLNLDTREIQFNSKIQNIFMNVNSAVPLGILINELLSNSIKHAKYKGNFLIINVLINKVNDNLIIEYEDNGNSFLIDKKASTLGLFIIENMIKQINGTFERINSKYTIHIKL
ncbi:sensor histidine kinase [Flavobacterium sp.]|jgi:two-component sensor histidine kinase|uniref:sensor histidine kinase n=1 Tax=Flavobacterium sp. TaxID=239 RepID=UPI002A822901|nr:sensor histidine kinase [Flavobacterium sp.]